MFPSLKKPGSPDAPRIDPYLPGEYHCLFQDHSGLDPESDRFLIVIPGLTQNPVF